MISPTHAGTAGREVAAQAPGKCLSSFGYHSSDGRAHRDSCRSTSTTGQITLADGHLARAHDLSILSGDSQLQSHVLASLMHLWQPEVRPMKPGE